MYAYLLVLIIVLLSGCSSLGPDYEKPSLNLQMQKEWIEYEENNVSFVPAVNVKWWEEAFDNAMLNHLIELSLKQNLSLRSAALKVLQARQKLAITVGNQYPQTQSISGETSRGSSFASSPSQEYDLGFDLSWELDVWGRYSRQIESASADLNVSIASYDGVMISLISDIATNYFQICTDSKSH